MKDFNDILPEIIAIRQDIHRHPELGLEEERTAQLVADTLSAWGIPFERGIAKTGLVATVRRPGSNRTVGFRADMDALPMPEETGLPYASQFEGKMHACGHDGHTASLLASVWRIANDPDFKGTAHFIFQPAEENIGGGEMMVKEGLFERFPCDRVYGYHNMPGIPLGEVKIKSGAMMAAIDAVTVTVRGQGGHGARPEETVDPIVAASSIVMALQTVVSRNASPHEPSVVTVGAFQSGSVGNIIPDVAKLEITMRTTNPSFRTVLRERVKTICEAQAQSFGASVSFEWLPGYPPTINHVDATADAIQAASEVIGADKVHDLGLPLMGSEDFSFFLEKVEGAYLFIGNGDTSGVHTSTYNFDDRLIETASAIFHRIARNHCDAGA